MKQVSAVEEQANDKRFAKMLNKAKRQVNSRRREIATKVDRNNKAHNDKVGDRKTNRSRG